MRNLMALLLILPLLLLPALEARRRILFRRRSSPLLGRLWSSLWPRLKRPRRSPR